MSRARSLVACALLLLSALPAHAQTPPYCVPSQAPSYQFGFHALHEMLGDTMGAPTSCEYGDPNGSGDTLQNTTNGLAFYRQSTNTPTFTNGFEHWALTPAGPVYWTGESIDPPGLTPSAQPANGIAATVVAVIDGDTADVRLADGTTRRLRIIGIDTPETVDPSQPVQCYGPEASERAKTLLAGQTVTLLPDPTQDQADRYGRMLVYVTLPDSRDVGEMLIREGFAREYTYRTAYQRQAAYRAAQMEAQHAGRGLWGACQSSQPMPTPQPQPTSEDRDCSDFATRAEAQAFFEAEQQRTGERDRHRLDADGNGLACESLP